MITKITLHRLALHLGFVLAGARLESLEDMLGAVFLVTRYGRPLPRDIPCDLLDSFVWFARYCIDCHVSTLSCLFSFRGAPCPLYVRYRSIPRYISSISIRPYTVLSSLHRTLLRVAFLFLQLDSLPDSFPTSSPGFQTLVLTSLRPHVLRSSRIAPTTTSFLIGPSSNTGASTCT